MFEIAHEIGGKNGPKTRNFVDNSCYDLISSWEAQAGEL